MPSDLDFAGPLREALLAADFTYDAGRRGCSATDGAPGARPQRDPPGAASYDRRARRSTTLVRLFLLQTPVARDEAERALPGLVDRLATPGCSSRASARSRPRLDVRPYAADGPSTSGSSAT